MKNLCKRQDGFSLIQATTALAIFSISSMMMVNLLQSIWQSNKTARISTTFQQLKIMTNGHLGNYEAWRRIWEVNSAITCVKPGGATCVAGLPQRIRVVSAIYDPADPNYDTVAVDTSANSGFAVDGSPCDNFDAVNGNDACPIHIDVDWRADCGGLGSCDKPINMVRVTFSYKPANPNNFPALNMANYNLDWTDRRSLSGDAYDVECGMDPWGMVYVAEPNKTFNTPTGTYVSDIRGCLDIRAYNNP